MENLRVPRVIGDPRGPSIMDAKIAEREAFLAQYRRVYLTSMCRERGVPINLRDAALHEATALIALAQELGSKGIQ